MCLGSRFQHVIKSDIYIKNRKAYFDYEIVETYVAGLSLVGTEVKTLRGGRASLVDAFCYFDNGEMFVKSLNIPVYKEGSWLNHDPLRVRKLLLTKKELHKLGKSVQQPGYTIVPLSIFTNDKGLFKMNIGLVRGKKQYDKRAAMKEADLKREIKENFNK